MQRLQEGDWQSAAILGSALLVCAAAGIWLHRVAKERSRLRGG
jgi:hypothetical protein